MLQGKVKKDIGIGLFFLVMSVAYFIGTLRINSYNPFGSRELSSKSIPQVLALIMFILSWFVLVPALLKAKASAGAAAEEKSEGMSRTTKIKLAVALGLLVLYIFFFARVGFLLSSIAYLSCMIGMLIPHKNKKTIALTVLFSVAVSLIVYTVFSKCLGLILPAGILGF